MSPNVSFSENTSENGTTLKLIVLLFELPQFLVFINQVLWKLIMNIPVSSAEIVKQFCDNGKRTEFEESV